MTCSKCSESVDSAPHGGWVTCKCGNLSVRSDGAVLFSIDRGSERTPELDACTARVVSFLRDRALHYAGKDSACWTLVSSALTDAAKDIERGEMTPLPAEND